MDQWSNHTWDDQFGPGYGGTERSFDFTLYFEDTILTIVPATVFLVTAIARAAWLVKKPQKVNGSTSRSTKLVSRKLNVMDAHC